MLEENAVKSEEEEESETVSSRGARNNSKKVISQIVICAMMFALAVVLEFVSSLIPFLHFPNGGSISLVMLPLCLAALFCGPLWGFGIGIAFGLINALMDGGFAYHWASVLLDYVLGFGCAGFAGFFRKPFYKKQIWAVIAAVAVACLLRFVCSFFSGVIVWNSFYDYDANTIQPDFSAASVTYSFAYNGGYMLPSCIICVVTAVLLMKPLFNVMNYTVVKPLIPANINEAKDIIPSFEKLKPFYLGLSFLFLILGAIPQLGVFWLSYFGSVIALSVLVYEIVGQVKHLNFAHANIYLISSAILFAVNLAVGIISPLALSSYYPSGLTD